MILMDFTIYDAGYDKTLSRGSSVDSYLPVSVAGSSVSTSSYSGGLGTNTTDAPVAPSSIVSGSLPALLYSKKEFFADTTAGYRMGVDVDGVYKWIIGDATSSADWSVTTLGTFTIKGTITAYAGIIGGWTINTTTLSATGIVLDAGNQRITVGSAVPSIVIDGVNKYVRTSTYTTGTNGWTIDKDGSAEFNNLFARGEFHTQTLSYGSVHVSAGSSVLALSGGTLKADVSTAGEVGILTEAGDYLVTESGDKLIQEEVASFNVDVNDPPSGHTQMFSVGDILRIKDGSGDDNWFTVVSASDQTTFFRYSCSLSSGTVSTFYAGAAIADYGQSGQGIIYMTVDGTNAPYISVQTHAGSPWDTITERVRMGNLNGFLDYATDLYGLAVGSSTGTNANITIESTNGIRIRQGTTDVFSVNNSGVASVGALVVATGGYMRSGQTAWDTGTGYWLGNVSTTPKFSLGNSSGNKMTWDGSALSVTGLFYGTVSGTALGLFTTTSSNNTTRISICDASGAYGTPSQVANSFAFVEGTQVSLIFKPTSSIGDFLMTATNHPDGGQGVLSGTSTATTDTTSDVTFGMVKLSATNASGKIGILSLSNAGDAQSLRIAHAGTTYSPIIIANTGVLASHFHRLIKGTTVTIWESDGTTPNGNFDVDQGATTGDICVNADSGKTYYCANSAHAGTWTAF